MIDLKILTIKDLLPITNVQYASGVTPLSLLITGSSMDQASIVLINDVEAPEFAVLSTGKLLAQIPTSQRNSVLRKIAIIATVPSTSRSSLLHFEINSMGSITGIEKLVQAFVKLLMQTPGSDRFRPTEGGGLLSLAGRTVGQGDTKTLQASAITCVTRTRDQLMARQGPDSRIPADERLLSATASAVGFDPTTTTLSANIALAAVSGQQAVANLTL